MNVFVSSQRIDEPHTAALIAKLRAAGFRVIHSPRNPLDGDDERWAQDWYDKGLIGALDASNVFIAAIDKGWDSSTWMAIEAHEALRRLAAGRIKRMYYYNPLHIAVTAMGMLRYLREQLPDDIEAAVGILKEIQRQLTE